MSATYEALISKYVSLRDTKEKIAKRHEEELKPYSDAMALIAQHLKNYLQANNLQNISSQEFVAFLHRTRSATVADTKVFREFVIENENFDLADFRARVEQTEDYVKDHEGKPPPGVNFSTAVTVRVNRK
jgi:hypothetical protein